MAHMWKSGSFWNWFSLTSIKRVLGIELIGLGDKHLSIAEPSHCISIIKLRGQEASLTGKSICEPDF